MPSATRRDAFDAVGDVTPATDSLILVGVPLRQETSSQWWVHWLTNHWMPRGAALVPVVGNLVHDARNQIVREALSLDGWQTLVMLDADVFPPPHEECDLDAFQLITDYEKQQLPVVGPLYFGRSMVQPTPVAGYFNDDLTAYMRLSDAQYRDVIARPGLHRIDVLGLGLVAFQRSVFEQLTPPWFSHPVQGDSVLGEDVQLYKRLSEQDIPVYLDSRWHALHLGHLYFGMRTYDIWRSIGELDAISKRGEGATEAALDR